MKKLYLMCTGIFILCLYCENTFAQTETDTTFATQMNYIFANVDNTKVPYGILRDYGMEFTNIENYNGTAALADSNYADATSFWDVYQTLLSSRINTTAFRSRLLNKIYWFYTTRSTQKYTLPKFFNSV